MVYVDVLSVECRNHFDVLLKKLYLGLIQVCAIHPFYQPAREALALREGCENENMLHDRVVVCRMFFEKCASSAQFQV